MKRLLVTSLVALMTGAAFGAEITLQEAREELARLLPSTTKGSISFEGSTFNGAVTRGDRGVALVSPIYEINQGRAYLRGEQVAVELELDHSTYMIDRTSSRSNGNIVTNIKLRNRRSREGYRDYVSKEAVEITRSVRGQLIRVKVSYQDKERSVSGTLLPKDWQDPTGH